LHLSDAERYASYMRLFDDATIRELLLRQPEDEVDEVA
jgi:hypothetical protein